MNFISKVENRESKQIKSNKFELIKNKFVFSKIFGCLTKKQQLYIAKYNNKLKGRMKINIKDYEEYVTIYSPIEIEIIPVKNEFGKLINIKNKEESYYHIYLNNNKKEIKRNILTENDNVTSIKVVIDYQIKSFFELFANCECIESIYFKKFFRNTVNNMRNMFSYCTSLKTINFYNFNTINVTNMSYMFSHCSSLKEINLSNFNTNNVTNMSSMFYGCSSLNELNLSNFNTEKVTNMYGMFWGCSALKELDLSNFNTDKVTNMFGMFYECSSIKKINFSNFSNENDVNMSHMFYGCRELNELILTNFNINNRNDMSDMFHGCSEELKKKIVDQINNTKKQSFTNYIL